MRLDCGACCFFRLVKARGKQKRLCQLTGEREPLAGGAGCCFIAGQWSQLDAILGLPTTVDCGNSGGPNYVKPGSGFSRNGMNVTNIHALDDFSVNPIDHIAEKLEGSPVRPGIREDQVAHIARERTRLPFFVFKTPTM